jgi:hypothetical protein
MRFVHLRSASRDLAMAVISFLIVVATSHCRVKSMRTVESLNRPPPQSFSLQSVDVFPGKQILHRKMCLFGGTLSKLLKLYTSVYNPVECTY